MFGIINRLAVADSSVLARRTVLVGSIVVALIGLYRIGHSSVVGGKLRFGNPVSGLPEATGALPLPLSVRAEVTRISGTDLARSGDTCDFLVELRQPDQGSVYCNAQITCGGKLLYGGPERGYFPCRFDGDAREVVGNDPTTTRQDKDPALHLDTRAGLLHIWDDDMGSHGAFDVEAEVLETH